MAENQEKTSVREAPDSDSAKNRLRRAKSWFAARWKSFLVFWKWFCAPQKWLAAGKMLVMKCTTMIKNMHKGLRDRLFLGITALIVAYVLSPVLDGVGISVSNYAHAQSWLWRLAFITVILAASGIALWKITAFRKSDLSSPSLITRTPSWILGLLATWIVMWGQTSISWAAALICTFLCAGIVYCIVRQVRRPISMQADALPYSLSEALQPCQQPRSADGCDIDLMDWLEDETPITVPGQDRFGHYVYAQSIARHLAMAKMPTIGLIGVHGCGKSSIVYLVEYYLNHPTEAGIILPKERFIFCRIPAWGAGKDSIAMFILQQAIAKVSKHIDCIGLRAIPAEYRAALASVESNWTGPIAALLGAHARPDELLKRLDETLITTGYRLVICLEDMDRNADNEEYRQHVHALLDRVKDRDSITFILSTSSDADHPVQLARFAEHIEIVRPIDPIYVGKTVKRMHGLCKFEMGSAKETRYRKDTEPQDRFGLTRESLGDPTYTSIIDSGIAPDLTSVLNQPRLLKLVTRRVHSAWKQLRGEISLEDFIVVTVIRTVAPAIIDDLIAHRQNPEEKNKEWVTQRIQETATKNSLDPEVILRLVTFLFPHLAADPKKATPIPLQGVADDAVRNYGIDYWQRAISEYIPPVQPSDQEVLHAIRDFLTSRILPVNSMTYALAEKVCQDDVWCASVNHFSTEFRVAEYLELTGQVFNLFLKENEHDAIATGLPWFNAFVRTMSTPSSEFRPPHEQRDRKRVTIGVYSTEVNTWLQKQIMLALPISLDFATDLFSCLHRKQMPIEFTKLIRQCYPRPDTFAEMLLHSDEEILLRISQATHEHKPDSWQDETKALLSYVVKVSAEYRDTIILQLHGLLSDDPLRKQLIPILDQLRPVLDWTPSLDGQDARTFDQLKDWIDNPSGCGDDIPF